MTGPASHWMLRGRPSLPERPASIAAGAKSKTVTGVWLETWSLVLATVQNNAGVSVAYVVPNVSLSKITINLDKVVPSGKTAKVAWFVVNWSSWSKLDAGCRPWGCGARLRADQ